MMDQNRKNFFLHIWHIIAPQHLAFMNNEDQANERPFFLLSETGK